MTGFQHVSLLTVAGLGSCRIRSLLHHVIRNINKRPFPQPPSVQITQVMSLGTSWCSYKIANMHQLDKTGWSHYPDFKLMSLMSTTPHGNRMMMRLITPIQWLLCAKYLLQARHHRKCLLWATSYFLKPLNFIMTFILQLGKKMRMRGVMRLAQDPSARM